MAITRLDDVDAFVVRDLDGLAIHAGVVRCAPKVLLDSSWTLARAATYQYAALGLEVGGASVGINAPPAERDTVVPRAIEALVASLPAPGALVVDAARGVADDDLAGVHTLDGRPSGFASLRHELTGAGVAAAVGAVRPLDGATIALESLDATALAFATTAAQAGARVVAVATTAGSATNPGGFDPAELAAAFATQGVDAPAALGGEPGDAVAVFAADVDVLAVGSKLGALDHTTAAGVGAGVVVATNWVPVTTRALAVLTRRDVTVLPDFVALAGAIPASGVGAGEPPASGPLDPAAAVAAGTEVVGGIMGEVVAATGDEWPNAVLAACARAEAFLTARGHEVPFGRPLG
jgi:glutamate dehydrogenase (NAD(P)+)